ncbi:hypothetical protein [Lysobacter enzymogenes]|uniref:hypothetical protein n=1 Tax=Lysobacter enzymogenes TaxID=69 RepID=UPI001AF378BE|nr:hypothetical protein [Lysobacter enzymogenes]QQQ02172.1 hypothetical protein JHW41_04060 [Lysobacter enzymogenes]
MQEVLAAQAQVLLKLDAGPCRHMLDAERRSGVGDPCSASVGDGAAADELEGIRSASGNCDSLFHIGAGLRQRQRVAVCALDNCLARRQVVELLDPGDVSSLAAARLAMPDQFPPARDVFRL